MQRQKRLLAISLMALGLGLVLLGAGQWLNPRPVSAQSGDDVSGAVFEDLNGNGVLDGGEPGIAGVWLTLTGPTNGTAVTQSLAGGSYTLTSDLTGTHTIDVLVPAGYTATSPATLTIDKQAGTPSIGNNFGLQQQVPTPTPTSTDTPPPTPFPQSIAGYAYQDLNGDGTWNTGEPGAAGVPVALSGPLVGNTTTGSDGFYIFLALIDGLYSVRADWGATGFQATSPDTLVITLSGGAGANDINFGGQAAPPTGTPTPLPTGTPQATGTPAPTNTPWPTNTSQPSNTPTPQPSNTPVATATAASGGACTMNADPDQNQAGTSFTFIGSGFSQNSAVAIGLMLPDGAVVGLPAQQANGAGSFAFTYKTEAGDQIGLYTMVAEGQTDLCRATAAFYVDDAPTPTPVSVVITAVPGDGGGGLAPLNTPEAIPTPEPEPTPDPLLYNKDPLLANIEVVALKEEVVAEPKMTPTPDGAELPGVGGAGPGFSSFSAPPGDNLETTGAGNQATKGVMVVFSGIVCLTTLLWPAACGGAIPLVSGLNHRKGGKHDSY